MLRHGAACGIVLAHELGDRLAVLLDRLVEHLRVLAGKVAVLKVQYRKAALRAAPETDRVGVRKGRGDHALLVRERLDRADAVAQRGGLFKAQLFRRLFHSFAQLSDQLLAFPLQDQRGLVDASAVILLRQALETPSGAAAHLVFQAGAVLADITRELPRTVRKQQGLTDRGDDLARLIAPAEGTVILPTVLRSVPG